MLLRPLFPLLLAALCPGASLVRAESPPKRPPNVLLILADDMRAESIGALGDPLVKTPNLDRLVARGCSFSNAYCLGGNSPAVCTPSRNMLLSGKAYFRWTGLQAPAESTTFPATFAAAGYATYHHGKRSNTAIKIQAQFEVNKYFDEDADRIGGDPGRQIADEAVDYLKSRGDDRPFFMYLGFANPHDPRVADRRYTSQYELSQIKLPRNFLPLHPFDDGEMAVRDERLAPWPRPAELLRQQWLDYYAVITAMDLHIGRVLDTLRDRGLEENTIVIFSADQGISLGSHGLLGKQNLYDAAMKSPLVLAGPGVRHGRSEALVYLLDIFPTVCSLANLETPSGMDGISIAKALQDSRGQARDGLLLAYRDVQRAYRDERWKLIRYPQVDVTQLFDLSADPDEMVDLSRRPENGDRLREMTAQLKAAQQRFGDVLPLAVDKPRSPDWTPPVDKTPAAGKPG